jgi:thiamine-phosphate pyrophosphorylase
VAAQDTRSTHPGRAEPASPAVLGRLLVLTDRAQSQAAGRPLVDTVAAAAGAGAPLVLFREKDLGDADRHALAREVADALAGTGADLVVASDVELAAELNAWGVHFAARDPLPAPTTTGVLLPSGRSCHSPADVATAVATGASWVTLSPVFPTASKPGYGPPLGTAALDGHAVPVFALGGVTSESAAACLEGGAHGLAVMGAVMRAPHPAAAVRELLDRIATAAPAHPGTP